MIGAEPGDSLSPQVWLDREHLYTVRMIGRGRTGARIVTDVGRHEYIAGGWIEREIRIYNDGELALLVRE